MIHLNALELLRRHAPLPFGWCEVIAGYDFGILSVQEIQDWLRTLGSPSASIEALTRLAGQDLVHFEARLWEACSEALEARVPRPGHRRWSLAQDLWRASLLKEILTWPLDICDLAEAVEALIDRVGCPEDMLGLVKRSPHGQPPTTDRERLERFLRDLEARLRTQGPTWATLAAS